MNTINFIYCFYTPYVYTLHYFSGYGLLTQKRASRKQKIKGAILYCLLWWLPFVSSAVAGSVFAFYFLSEKLINLITFLATVIPHVIIQGLQSGRDALCFSIHLLREFCDAVCEILHDAFLLIKEGCFLIKQMFQRSSPDAADPDQQEAPCLRNTSFFQDVKQAWRDCHNSYHSCQHELQSALHEQPRIKRHKR